MKVREPQRRQLAVPLCVRGEAVDRIVDELEPKLVPRDLVDLFARLLPIARPETVALTVLERHADLSTAELGQRYRAARQPIERSHLQIVWLLSQGRSDFIKGPGVVRETVQQNDRGAAGGAVLFVGDAQQRRHREVDSGRLVHVGLLHGSAGLYRLREELLTRVRLSAAPAKVSDVLFKEMLVQ